VKWINTQQLREWAGRVGTREEFPVMIRDLVLASVKDIGDIRSIRFPGGEAGQARGYDGELNVAVSTPNFPKDRSIWEFGVGDDPAAKFASDYKKRVKEIPVAERATMTLIFATPRVWDKPRKKLPNFLKAYKDKKDFADVRYIDGAELEQWLDLHGAVGAKYAKQVIGFVPETGALSTDEFWDAYSKQFQPTLTEKVALSAREEQASRMVEHLMGRSGTMILVGDAPDEVSAVAVAAIRSASKDNRSFLEARTLIVSRDEAAIQLSVPNRYSFLVAPSAQKMSGALSSYGPVISSLDFKPMGQRYERLERPSVRMFGEALRTMFADEALAELTARKSGRSLAILERQIAAAGARRPAWADQGADLVPALLAGSWDSRHEGDKRVMAVLAGKAYDEVEAKLRPLLERQDSPIDREGGVWKLRAPVDALTVLAASVGSEHIARLKLAVTEVFTTTEPPNQSEERFGTSEAPYTSWIRGGLANTLLMLSALHEEVGIDAGEDPSAMAEDLIAGLPGLNSDAEVLLSLDQQLPYLMEAVPDPLLAALEHLLEGETETTAAFFADIGEFGFPRTRLPNLLWALEVAAWDPTLLARVSLILAGLDDRDPGGRHGNRPLASLRGIFVAWSPGTNATLEDRMAAIDTVSAKYPAVGWRLLVKLLPTIRDAKGPTQRPRFRDAGASEREPLTDRIVERSWDELTDRVLLQVGDQSERWIALIKAFPQFSDDRRSQFLDMLDAYARSTGGDQRTEVRRALQSVHDRHQRFAAAEWSLPKEDVDRLAAIIKSLEGEDPVENARLLFDEWLPLRMEDHEIAERETERLRSKAVASIAASTGAAGILELAAKARLPRLVARAVALSVTDEEAVAAVLASGDPNAAASEFVVALAGMLRDLRGPAFDETLAGLAQRHSWSSLHTATALLDWPEKPEAWDFVGSLGATVSTTFWERRQPRLFDGTPDELEALVLKYLAAGKAGNALIAIQHHEGQLSWPLIATILGARVEQINAGEASGDMDSYYVEELFESLRGRDDVPKLDLARWEYAYFPLLEYRQSKLTIFELMASDPEFFVSILKDVFVEDGTNPDDQQSTEEQRNRGNASHRILIAFDQAPGEKDGKIDEAAMTAWVDGMLSEGAKAKRMNVVPSYIGRALAHASPVDDVWPPAPVARVIERLKSPDLERGMTIERYNMRGVYSKAMFEGGRQEQDLAQEARIWAKANAAHPRTKAMLNTIAKRWDAYAKEADEQAGRDRLRFE
jgi:hypothetical protein